MPTDRIQAAKTMLKAVQGMLDSTALSPETRQHIERLRKILTAEVATLKIKKAKAKSEAA